MVQRYDMIAEYNKYACEDQVTEGYDDSGKWVLFTDYESLEADDKVLRREGMDSQLAQEPEWARPPQQSARKHRGLLREKWQSSLFLQP